MTTTDLIGTIPEGQALADKLQPSARTRLTLAQREAADGDHRPTHTLEHLRLYRTRALHLDPRPADLVNYWRLLAMVITNPGDGISADVVRLRELADQLESAW